MKEIQGLIQDFSRRPEVESIALGGSRASKTNDQSSDYDIYIYLKEELPQDIRREILTPYCSYMEINNQYWEIEDDCRLKSGTIIEIIYRRLEDFAGAMKSVVRDCNAGTGYTTCMWSNLLNSMILYDYSNKLKQLKEEYTIPYPQKLRSNIIKKNMELLDGKIPSYSYQIEKALEREDLVSINHRITELLASYFDIIFAWNRQPHPGEKRLIPLCLQYCESLPQDFEANLHKLLGDKLNKAETMTTVQQMVENLKKLMKRDAY